jgi:HD superfamily phosphohydrolase
MLNIWKDQLVVDEKGIYSIEKFLISRRLMYWQVYLHKTVVSAESLLINVLKRAKELAVSGESIYTTPTLKIFLHNDFAPGDFKKNIEVEGKSILTWYSLLDDNDISISIKEWQFNPDPVLSMLANSLNNRKLFRIQLLTVPVLKTTEEKILKKITREITGNSALSGYFLMTGEITNNAYDKHNEKILVLDKTGKTKDMQQASDINLTALTKTVRKYFLCFPKELDIN